MYEHVYKAKYPIVGVMEYRVQKANTDKELWKRFQKVVLLHDSSATVFFYLFCKKYIQNVFFNKIEKIAWKLFRYIHIHIICVDVGVVGHI